MTLCCLQFVGLVYKIHEHPGKIWIFQPAYSAESLWFHHLGSSGAVRSGQSLVWSWTTSRLPPPGRLCSRNLLEKGCWQSSPASGRSCPGRRWRGVPPCNLLRGPTQLPETPLQRDRANTDAPSLCSSPQALWSLQSQTPMWKWL